jgi:hypothetical protein
MKMQVRGSLSIVAVLVLTLFCLSVGHAQGRPAVLAGQELTRIVPTGFYFEGQSAPTQMRNAAAARVGRNRNVIAGLVDTSGYSSDIRAKYEGFLITDSDISIGGEELRTGAYGFGFTNDGRMNVFDISGRRVLTVDAVNDRDIRRPRPLMMSMQGDALRLYARRSYVVIRAR